MPPRAVPARCIVDASVLIKVVVTEPESHLARALLKGALLDARAVPDLAYVECASILATGVRSGTFTPDQARARYVDLLALSLTVHPTTPLVDAALGLAITHAISVYDAVYVALADAMSVPLVTADVGLVRSIGNADRVGLLADYALP
jgi:predicted nucleic acid-binding protein